MKKEENNFVVIFAKERIYQPADIRTYVSLSFDMSVITDNFLCCTPRDWISTNQEVRFSLDNET